MYRWLCLLASLATVVGLLGLLLTNTLARDWLVVAFGIRTFNRICGIILFVASICLLVTVIASIPLAQDNIRQQRQRRQSQKIEQAKNRALESYAEEGATPENTRAVLVQLIENLPDSHALVNRCHGQMTKMDALQERQYNLISSNNAQYLEKTNDVLDGVEKRICRNIWSIRNLYVAAGTAARLNQNKVQSYLDDNQIKLNDAERLLNVSADWINQYDRNGETDLEEVNRWINVIERSLKEDVDE